MAPAINAERIDNNETIEKTNAVIGCMETDHDTEVPN